MQCCPLVKSWKLYCAAPCISSMPQGIIFAFQWITDTAGFQAIKRISLEANIYKSDVQLSYCYHKQLKTNYVAVHHLLWQIGYLEIDIVESPKGYFDYTIARILLWKGPITDYQKCVHCHWWSSSVSDYKHAWHVHFYICGYLSGERFVKEQSYYKGGKVGVVVFTLKKGCDFFLMWNSLISLK